jgi:S-adenosylmethionine hydrolase
MKTLKLNNKKPNFIIDISHGIARQNVAEGAFVLGETTRWFPAGTIHLAVFDPGVGTDRRIVYARVGGQQYVCPDNGLLSYVGFDNRPEAVFEVTNRSLFLPEVSYTFHGRDIMAPVAARLSLGLAPQEVGPAVNDLELFEWPRPERRDDTAVGKILFADSFGNLLTNFRREDLPEHFDEATVVIECGRCRIEGIRRTYGTSDPGTLVALFGSSGLLELAIVQGSAAAQTQLALGDQVRVRWRD